MPPPNRMRQVYDGGPPGKFKFPIRPFTVVFVAVLAFALVHRFGVFSGDDTLTMQTRLDVAAAQLETYYVEHGPNLGHVTHVDAGATEIKVGLLLSDSERQSFAASPELLRRASLRAVCPDGGDRVWDLIGANQSIDIDAVTPAGTIVLRERCARLRF